MLSICKTSLFDLDSIIVFAPHPDDEVFGCCGLMQQMLTQDKRVELIVMTGGEKSHSGCCGIREEKLIHNRRKLTYNAAAVYGLSEEHIHYLNYPDGGICFNHKQTELLRGLLFDISKKLVGNIAILYPHTKGEGWADHMATSQIAEQLSQDILPQAKRYEYCVWFWYYNSWEIDWKNARVIKMTEDEYNKKLDAMEVYIKPLAPCRKPWSGVLPPIFLWANKWNKELYFRKS